MRNCDIVMKGGVTSGIVYPAAVCEIAKRFVFKNVGGTSAGAIAAVLTAAAEFRRQQGDEQGFDLLCKLPDELAEPGGRSKELLLARLFHPNPSTRALYRTLLALAGRQPFEPAWLARLLRLIVAYPGASALGAVLGIVLLVALVALHGGWLAFIAAVLVLFCGIAIADVIALARDLLARLPKNYFGLVTGMESGGDDPVLTQWLHDKIQTIAGLGPDTPLTFAMLWNGSANAPTEQWDVPPNPVLTLEMISTCVTLGRPYCWPTHLKTLYFHEDEMRAFFPASVVTWMKDHARKPDEKAYPGETQRMAERAKQRLYPMPLPGDVPVIVATRMSLAFPVLLSAVPLYSTDYSKASNWNAPMPDLERVWFSDGGLSSNFPVSLFDTPLPRWPTFAINLQGLPNGQAANADESKNVYMPKSNSAGRLPVWTRFQGIAGFFGAIFNTMQNWRDSTMLPLPGYRDRIVTIMMAKDEGGLNLDMPIDVLKRLQQRGAIAGAMIAARFDDPRPGFPVSDAPKMNWENHRTQRFGVTMGALAGYLGKFAFEYTNPQPQDASYQTLAATIDPGLQPLTNALSTSGASLADDPMIAKHFPRPHPVLEIGPELDH